MAYRYNVFQTNLEVNLTFKTTVSNSNGKKMKRKLYDSFNVGLPVTLRKANGTIRRDIGHDCFLKKGWIKGCVSKSLDGTDSL